MPVSLVWFKRDLRVSDNPALFEAVKSQLPVICLFNIEPKRLHRSDVDSIHIEWELDCLRELKSSLELIGGKLLFNFGSTVDELTKIDQQYQIKNIYCNEETGLSWSWDIDKSVAKWCFDNDVEFIEYPTNGVVRRLDTRDNWKKERDLRVNQDLIKTPEKILSPIGLESDDIPNIEQLGLTGRELQQRPVPGEKAALSVLFSFLDQRGRTYRKDMSSPITGQNACSRLSPYLSTGCISIKQIFYHTRRKQKRVKQDPRSKENRGWTSSLSSFQSRLAWHCHFIHCLERRKYRLAIFRCMYETFGRNWLD